MIKAKQMPVNKLLVLNLFVIGFLFQIYLISQFPFFYHLLKVLFVIEVILLAAGLVKISKKEKFFIFCVLAIIAIRIPFYVHSTGLLFTSDNALEALQPLEIRDTKIVPFYLFESAGHNGTIKYLLIAFISDFLGRNYLSFLLFELIIFIIIFYLLYELLKKIIDKNILLLLLFTNFAFIEVIFDHSLFLRAGPYLGMLFFFLLGAYLFDFEFKNKTSIFLSYYFFLYSIYVHPTGFFFVLGFVLCALIYSAASHNFSKNLALLSGGSLCGGFHLIYYELFISKPPPTGEWYRMVFLSPSELSFEKIPLLATKFVSDFKAIFRNIFNFEFSYSKNFFEEGKTFKSAISLLNQSLIYLSFIILLVALVLIMRKFIVLRKGIFNKDSWIYLFFIALFLIVLAKIFLLSPKPFHEPRHNLDLAFLVMLSYLFVFSAFFKIKKILSLKSMLIIFFLLVWTFPHYYYFLKTAHFKEDSYRRILYILERNRVKYLTTDFIIAYPIYFLSDRKILVSDSLGPLTIGFFYPLLKAKVDQIPPGQKAYLFFSDAYFRRDWHKRLTRRIQRRILNYLNEEKISYKVFDLEYYKIIIPSPSRRM